MDEYPSSPAPYCKGGWENPPRLFGGHFEVKYFQLNGTEPDWLHPIHGYDCSAVFIVISGFFFFSGVVIMWERGGVVVFLVSELPTCK